MKTIKLTSGTETIYPNGQPQKLKYSTKDYLRVIANAPIGQGFTADDIRKRIDLLNKIDKIPADAEVFKMQDADYELVKNTIKDFRWGVVANSIIQFTELFK